MYQTHARRSAWPFALMVAVPVLFVVAGVWWLESRFGAGVALMVIGGLLGVICFIVGYVLSMANSRHALQTAAQFNADLATVERARMQSHRAELGIYREYARGEREAFAHRAKLDAVDRKEVQRLARQQAHILVDAQRQQPANTWAAVQEDETETDGDFRYYDW